MRRLVFLFALGCAQPGPADPPKVDPPPMPDLITKEVSPPILVTRVVPPVVHEVSRNHLDLSEGSDFYTPAFSLGAGWLTVAHAPTREIADAYAKDLRLEFHAREWGLPKGPNPLSVRTVVIPGYGNKWDVVLTEINTPQGAQLCAWLSKNFGQQFEDGTWLWPAWISRKPYRMCKFNW